MASVRSPGGMLCFKSLVPIGLLTVRSGQRAFENAPRDLPRVEVLLRQRPRQPAVPLVVRLDGREGADGLIRGPEAEETLGVRQKATRAGVLDHGRFATGQVAQTPVANPGVLEPRARGLCATELPPGSLHVGAVLFR